MIVMVRKSTAAREESSTMNDGISLFMLETGWQLANDHIEKLKLEIIGKSLVLSLKYNSLTQRRTLLIARFETNQRDG